MARVNVGVNPKYLADQHLIAESVEITMITGGFRKNGYVIKSQAPEQFSFGKGHINFFKDKLLYLNRRLQAVNDEMVARGFSASTSIADVLSEAPGQYINDWVPSPRDTNEIRQRIASRLINRANGKPGQGYYRYKRSYIQDVEQFSQDLLKSQLYYV
jgi:deoxyribonuclease (pyrimidine dimer)